MAKFVDKHNRTWVIEVTPLTLKRVKQLLEVDLLEIWDGVLIHQINSNYILLVDILCAILLPQLEKSGISQEEFAESIHGAQLEDAGVALWEAIVNFFPPRKAQILRGMLEKSDAISGELLGKLEEKMKPGGEVDTEVRRKIKEYFDQALSGNSSMKQPE